MQAIQTELDWFDKYVKLLAAILCRLDRKLPFITLVYFTFIFLTPFESLLEHIGPGIEIAIQSFLNIPLHALSFSLSFFSLLNLGANARRANRLALILSLMIIAIHGNAADFMSDQLDVFCHWISSAIGVFAGYAIVQYYIVAASIGKWE
jgi:hypothetical protein